LRPEGEKSTAPTWFCTLFWAVTMKDGAGECKGLKITVNRRSDAS